MSRERELLLLICDDAESGEIPQETIDRIRAYLDEPQGEPSRPRNASDQEEITMPDGVTPWTNRAMTREHVEKIRESHWCAGWDCVACVWLATLDSLMGDQKLEVKA